MFRTQLIPDLEGSVNRDVADASCMPVVPIWNGIVGRVVRNIEQITACSDSECSQCLRAIPTLDGWGYARLVLETPGQFNEGVGGGEDALWRL